MQASSWLIDDLGEVLVADPLAIARRVGIEPIEGTSDYLISNMGWIGLTLRRGSWHIRLRPKVVSDCAVVGLLYWLRDHPSRPSAISWLDKIWQLERAESTEAAISLLGYLLDRPNANTRSSPKFLSKPSGKAEAIWTRASSTVLPLLNMAGPSPVLFAAMDHYFNKRWSLLEVDKGSLAVSVIKLGKGYPPLHPSFNSGAHGKLLSEIADQSYSDWVARSYQAVAESGQPICEEVDAVIRWPRLGEIRTRYLRVIIPVANFENSCRVMSASTNDSGIDLRPKNIEKLNEVFDGFVGGHPKQHRF